MGGHVALEHKETGREGKGRGAVSRVNEVLSTVIRRERRGGRSQTPGNDSTRLIGHSMAL